MRLLLVDDEALVRRGLRMRLALEADIEIVGEADNGIAALERSASLQPDIVVMDVRMPQLDGISATTGIRAVCPDTAILLLTMHDDAGTRARATEAGAAALISKHLIDDELLPMIRRLASGDPDASGV